ncbi:glycosyltransferase family 4 protein [Motiliproteus sediminis]|uniref:glycosyltransferase family 4 protein n=1 Tax=Motiliproteus sediminis TaxID=1468178 RepID=UPI001AEFC3A4|nr:glycosyltransferase family 4 protein [Motiliproteus sediminis]
MKLLVISSYTDTWNSVRPEAEMIIGLKHAGVDVTLMTQGDAEYVPRFRDQGVEVIDFHPRKKFSWSAIERIRAELKRGRYDVLYLFNNKAITSGLLAAVGLPVKVVNYRGQTGNIYRHDPASYLTHLNPRVDGIIGVANAVRDDLRPRVFLPEERVITVYKGHDLAWYENTQPADLTQEFGIPAEAVKVICVANARPRKGMPLLIEAFGQLQSAQEVHLILVGGGMDAPEFQQLVSTSPASQRIHVAGFRKDVPQLVSACDISVLPSLKREGLPKTVIEAMAYGVAPIVSDTGGSAELVEPDVSGIVVEPGKAEQLTAAMQRLVDDADSRQKMGAAARVRLGELFTVDRAVADTHAFFIRLTQS